jgi:predicted RNase H-like HicB family nuclease
MALFTKPVLVQIEANLLWEVARHPSTGRFIGVCRPLNLNAVGDTWAEFQECANEALQVLFADLFKEGELEEFLRRNGWRVLTPLPARSSPTPRFDVPFSLERRARFEELVPA